MIVFAALLHVLPFPHSFTNQLHIYVQQTPLNLLKYMLLPVTAIFLNMFFQTTYSWRTFFLLQAGEDRGLGVLRGLSYTGQARACLVVIQGDLVTTAFVEPPASIPAVEKALDGQGR